MARFQQSESRTWNSVPRGAVSSMRRCMYLGMLWTENHDNDSRVDVNHKQRPCRNSGRSLSTIIQFQKGLGSTSLWV